MVPSVLQLIDRDSVFVDFATSLLTPEDANDPLFPYTPPSLTDSIAQLMTTTAPGSVKALILSVPYVPRSVHTDDALAALRKLLASPACNAMRTVKISGSCHLLNDRWTLDAFKRSLGLEASDSKHGAVEELILQVDGDSYAVAAILDAFEGIKKLRCILGEVHSSFKAETRRTMEKLEELDIEITGDAFQAHSLRALRSLRVTFDSWEEEGGALGKALEGCDLASVELHRRACAHTKRSITPRTFGFEPYSPAPLSIPPSPANLLAKLSTLGHLEIASESANEPLSLTADLFDSIPASIASLTFKNIASPLKLLTELRHRIPFSYSKLEVLRVDLHLHTQEGWSFVLGLLADDLEQMGIAHRLILRSELKKEERVFGLQ